MSAGPRRVWKAVQVIGFLIAAGAAVAFSVEGAFLAPIALLLGVLIWGLGRFMQWWARD